jgi:hypothetical protein
LWLQRVHPFAEYTFYNFFRQTFALH